MVPNHTTAVYVYQVYIPGNPVVVLTCIWDMVNRDAHMVFCTWVSCTYLSYTGDVVRRIMLRVMAYDILDIGNSMEKRFVVRR